MASISITHPIHSALYRPVLFLGVEQSVAMLEATIVFALLVGVGLHLTTVVLALVILGVVHPLMQSLTTRDADISRVYLRSVIRQDYYPAHAALHARVLSCPASIPSVR